MKTRIALTAALLSACLVTTPAVQADNSGVVIGALMGAAVGVALTSNYSTRVEYVSQPVYYRQEVQYAPRPVYYQQEVEYIPQRAYYRPPVIVAPAPAYIVRQDYGRHYYRERDNDRDHRHHHRYD